MLININLKKKLQNTTGNNTDYTLNEGEMYCISCEQVIKKTNLNRHDNSLKHERAVLQFVERMKLNY